MTELLPALCVFFSVILAMGCFVLDLIHDSQDILDLKAPPVVFDAGISGSKDSDEDLDRPSPSNSNYQKAKEEVEYLGKFKRKKYRHIMDREKSVIRSNTDDHGKVYETMVGSGRLQREGSPLREDPC